MNLSKILSNYKPSFWEAGKDLFIHSVISLSSLYATWYYRTSYLSVLTVPLLGLMNVRTFVVFHDCGHNSYTPSKRLNYVLGSILGTLVFTPFCWSYDHHNHHLTTGNKENTLSHNYNENIFHTLKEYKRMHPYLRTAYKIVKHPLVFGVPVASFYFVIVGRLSVFIHKLLDLKPYTQTLSRILYDTTLTNIGIYILLKTCIRYGIVYHYLLAALCGQIIGFFLFHNQHTFNPAYVVGNDTWNKVDSGLRGSSFIQVPWFLRYFMNGIEYHHIHHMSSSIPGYKIHKVHNELVQHSEFKEKLSTITTLTMTECFHNLWLTLYDEDKGMYSTFEEADKEADKDKDK